LKVGNDDAPQGWANAPAPVSVTVRPGMGIGGADRVSIIWPDGAIVGQWLQVSVLATPATGLEAEDVFFFGNAIGDTGNSPTDALVTVTDELATRSSYRGLADLAPIDEVTDFNRDRLVNVTDRIITRNHCGGLGGALELITAPAVDRMDVDLGAVLAAASDSIEFSWLAEIELEVPSTRGESTNAEMRKHAAIDQLLASLAE